MESISSASSRYVGAYINTFFPAICLKSCCNNDRTAEILRSLKKKSVRGTPVRSICSFGRSNPSSKIVAILSEATTTWVKRLYTFLKRLNDFSNRCYYDCSFWTNYIIDPATCSHCSNDVYIFLIFYDKIYFTYWMSYK